MIAYITRAILLGVPMLFGATGEILTEKSGHLNLGIPGIMYVGAISGVVGSFLYEKSCGNDIANMNPALAVLIPLICVKGNGEEAVDQTHQHRADNGAEHGDQDRQRRYERCTGCVASHFIEKCANNTADTTHIHNAGDTQVQVTGLFGDNFTGRTVQQRDAQGNGTGNKSKKHTHYACPPFFRLRNLTVYCTKNSQPTKHKITIPDTMSA